MDGDHRDAGKDMHAPARAGCQDPNRKQLRLKGNECSFAHLIAFMAFKD